MLQHVRGLNSAVPTDPDPALSQKPGVYDKEAFLPLSLIRSHTKTDDIPAVSDELLGLYRDNALFAAEQYTGLLLSSRKVMVEDVRPPIGTDPRYYRKTTFRHNTQYAIADPVVWYYGHKNRRPTQLRVPVNTTTLVLPRDHDDFGLGCCNPCGGEALAKIQYVAGFDCLSNAPAPIRLGALKYIAHVVENPGDNVVTKRTTGNASSDSDQIASDPAISSGAVEIWRTALPGAI